METVYQIVKDRIRSRVGEPTVLEFELPCYKKQIQDDATEEGLLRLYKKKEQAEMKIREFDGHWEDYRIVEMKLI